MNYRLPALHVIWLSTPSMNKNENLGISVETWSKTCCSFKIIWKTHIVVDWYIWISNVLMSNNTVSPAVLWLILVTHVTLLDYVVTLGMAYWYTIQYAGLLRRVNTIKCPIICYDHQYNIHNSQSHYNTSKQFNRFTVPKGEVIGLGSVALLIQ